MRQIDRWVGLPLCAALTALRRLGDLWRRARKPKPAPLRRILFVKLAEQGATVLAYPAIQRAVDMVGRENVYFLVFEENRFILDVMDVIPQKNVITISTAGFRRFVAGGIRALLQLRKLRPDAAVDFEFFARSSAALTYLSGARARVGLHAFGDKAPYRGDLMTHRIRYDPHLHTTQAFAAMVGALNLRAEAAVRGREGSRHTPCAVRGGREACGVEAVPPDQSSPSATWADGTRCVPATLGEDAHLPPVEYELPVFSPRPEELADVRAVVRREAGTSHFSPLVLLNANASDLLPLRRWPADRYVELARRLIERMPNLHVAFTGAPGEADVAGELVAAIGSDRCFSMAGKTTLRQLLVLYCLADLLVTNDSGPAHFATLTPIRVVTLFGPETPALFGSKSPRARVVWKDLHCSPCVNAYNNRLSTCRDNQCMQEITVDEVFDLAWEALRLAGPAGT